MSGDIQKASEFDPRDLATRLRDKIRVDMAELMPDDVWTGLLEAELQSFFKPKKTQQRQHPYREIEEPSPFSVIVQEEMSKLVKAKIVERVRVKLMAEVDKATGEFDTQVMDYITANVSTMVEGWFTGIIRGQLASMTVNVDIPSFNEHGQKIDQFGNIIY